ncbi:NUDIX domain-containing protein [Actinomycetota bacterium]
MSEPLLHPRLDPAALRDRIEPRPVLSTETAFEGMVWDVHRERVDLGEAACVTREFVKHTGAVSVLALDDDDRLVMIQQYRHPVGVHEWELPAGLLDEPGEDPATAAARELAEEVDLRAERWEVLIDYFASPGGMDEALRVFLARGLSAVPGDERHTRDAEEHGMPTGWVSLDDAHEAVLAGRLHNPSACLGILAAHASRARGWSTLRPADTPWPEHPAYR